MSSVIVLPSGERVRRHSLLMGSPFAFTCHFVTTASPSCVVDIVVMNGPNCLFAWRPSILSLSSVIITPRRTNGETPSSRSIHLDLMTISDFLCLIFCWRTSGSSDEAVLWLLSKSHVPEKADSESFPDEHTQ